MYHGMITRIKVGLPEPSFFEVYGPIDSVRDKLVDVKHINWFIPSL